MTFWSFKRTQKFPAANQATVAQPTYSLKQPVQPQTPELAHAQPAEAKIETPVAVPVLYEYKGQWYPKAEATALADADQAKAAEALKEAQAPSTPLVTQSPVVSETIAPAPLSALPSFTYTIPANTIEVNPSAIGYQSSGTFTFHPAASVAQPVQETAVSTAPVVAQPSEFKKIIKAIGHDLAVGIGVADKIQNLPEVQAAESIAFGPSIGALITRVLNEAQTVETSSAVAIQNASAAGLTDTQKAAIVTQAVTSDAQALATKFGAAPLTQAKLKTLNDAAIAIAGIFEVPVVSA